ncbi:class I SAM-dependent methyltransferase [Kibdelosporangium philippinense]|uniref:Class I SAM-dependent methyltransferase n=1 Tax=Kibdelosporangium philippinense TaxID=211113 RepID=A0ABS8ZCK7_9PSEU|nr:class I SAM-dependent methyltransferase [Kibdelosporangium philippinense]MCE7005237.1 class I SAM-dependent methyltransferase [Kibdelosporangium philippinense]
MTTTDKQHWESQAANWVEWARKPGFDAYWHYRERFFDLIPAPGGVTVDVGCGEGRLSRDLASRGYAVTGVEPAPGLRKAAQEAHPEGKYVDGEASNLPFQDASVDLLVSYNMLMDVDDLDGALREFARVLKPSGKLAITIVHPVADSIGFDQSDPEAPFTIDGSYLATSAFNAVDTKEGISMHFSGWHRSIGTYAEALRQAGLLIETIREPVPHDDSPEDRFARWRRFPAFMQVLATTPGVSTIPTP